MLEYEVWAESWRNIGQSLAENSAFVRLRQAKYTDDKQRTTRIKLRVLPTRFIFVYCRDLVLRVPVKDSLLQIVKLSLLMIYMSIFDLIRLHEGISNFFETVFGWVGTIFWYC